MGLPEPCRIQKATGRVRKTKYTSCDNEAMTKERTDRIASLVFKIRRDLDAIQAFTTCGSSLAEVEAAIAASRAAEDKLTVLVSQLLDEHAATDHSGCHPPRVPNRLGRGEVI